MVRLAISVEGDTEEHFVKKLIIPHLKIETVANLQGRISLSKIGGELNRLAGSHDFVTTLYDFYGFRGKSSKDNKQTLEEKILDNVAAPKRSKIIPYIQMYEFEALLFSSPDAIESEIGERGLSEWAEAILRKFGGNPERINDSKQTAPSKRLKQKTGYRKTDHGPNIANEIGLPVLREKCSGFDEWLTQLENLQE